MEDIKTIEATPAKDLPACPVETTLMLIGDKWKVLILRDLMPGTKRFGELKKIHRSCVPEGADRTASGYGGKRAVKPQGLCRGTTPCRVHTNRSGLQLEAYSGRPMELGRRIQGQTIKKPKQHHERRVASVFYFLYFGLNHLKILQCFSDCFLFFRRTLGLLGIYRFGQVIVFADFQSTFSLNLRNIKTGYL